MGADASVADVDELIRTYRTWGRWGPNDELGTLNYIGADQVRDAARLVRTGRVVSCALPYDKDGPQTGRYGRNNPQHLMLMTGSDWDTEAQAGLDVVRYADDAIFMPLQCGTQWDALSHIFHNGQMYNGYSADLVTSLGAARNGIEVAAARVVGRGVLLDVAAYRGVEWLEPGEGIGGRELEACADHEGLDVREGDIVLVRTGQLARVRATGHWGDYAGGPAPGLSLSSAEFLCDRRVAAVATDTWGMEVLPNETPDCFQPLHIVLIVNVGMLVGEMFDLDGLASECASQARWEFLFVASPLPFTGAVGSPLNPTAIL